MNGTNVVEYRIAGVRRSGIHAVAMWVFDQSRGRRVLLNDVNPLRDPWQNLANIVVPDGAAPLRKDEPRDCLMLIFEDRRLEAIAGSTTHRFVGASRQVHTILVLRDPFNLLASRLRWTKKPGAAARLTDPIVGRDLWLEYAREFVGHTTVLPSAMRVNYNRWVTDAGYRTTIGRRLGLPQPHQPMKNVPFFGGGSSFDGQQYDGRAGKMRLFDRWREFADDPQFLQLVDHAELLNLCTRVFGARPFAELYDRLRVSA
jgi:hypothetical protein